ncbi:hypothetical protein P7D22_22775, partial [Lichenihabitans sp. Uapishka_5]|uniref:hypothetical protein n=1 Tax=Lichenihabitans sp. Uapishka_5 TaxID=3037302 RepID=UPI0029E7D4A6
AAALGFATLVVTGPAGFESRTALALGLADRVAGLGLRPVVIDADAGRTLLRDLIEPGAGADLVDLMGATRVCYWAPTDDRDPIGLIPRLADEAQVVQRLRGREGLRHLEGLRDHFDVIIFDGPALDEGAQLRDVAASAGALLVVVPAETTAEAVATELASRGLPPDLRVTTVAAAPLLAVASPPGGAKSAAA